MSTNIVVSIGNEGSILTVNSGKNVTKTLYIGDLNSEKNRIDVENILKQFKRIPIYFILDNIGQNYIKRSFMNVNYFDLQKIVARKFNYEIPKNDLKEKRFMGKNPATNEWEYMFISSPIDDFLQDWINLIETKENVLLGIYMLPLEAENVIKIIAKKLFNKHNKIGEWCSILFENKISGFREVVFYKQKLLFTRILDFDLENNEKFMRSFLDTKVRTTDYLRRFSKDFDEKKMSSFAVISSDKKKMLIDVTNSSLKSFNFREFGAVFGEKDADKYQQEYCDVLLQKIIMKNKKIISFSNAEMKEVMVFSGILNTLRIVRNIIALVVPVAVAMLFVLMIKTKADLIKINHNLKEENLELDKRKKEEFGEKAENASEITEVSSFYNNIKTNQPKPFNFIVKFSENSYDIVMVNDFKWARSNYEKHIFYKYKSSFSVTGVLINKSGKVDDLFKIHDTYKKKLKDIFSDYDIAVSDLPKNINFSTNYYHYPLKIDFMEK